MEIKVAKPKAKGVTIQEPSEFRTTSPPQPSQSPQAKEKGKGSMVEPKKPLKKKYQIVLDEEVVTFQLILKTYPFLLNHHPLNIRGSTNQEGNRERQLRLSDSALSFEQTKTNQAAKIEKLKKRVQKLEGKKKKRTYGLKRLYEVGLSARVESSEDKEGLGAQEDTSKQRRIAEIDANEVLFLIDKTAQDQGRIKDQDLFGVHDLYGDEVFVDVTTGENVDRDATVAESVEVKTVNDDVRLQALVDGKKVIVNEATIRRDL
nr:hypothetical protein [Tanacetum cinerariifolium]